MYIDKQIWTGAIVAIGLAFGMSAGLASEITAKTNLVDGLRAVPDGDRFAASYARFVAPTSIGVEVSSGGGCRSHDYVLHVSKRVKESAPPIIEAKLTLDKHGDRCKAIISDILTFDLADLGATGHHILELHTGRDMKSILIDLPVPAEPATVSPLSLKSGYPTQLGDPLISLNDAEIVSGIFGMTLIASVTYTGGCQAHDYEAWWDGSFQKSLPPRASIIIVHNANSDTCKAMIDQEIQIDVNNILDVEPGVVVDLHSLNTQSIDVTAP